MKIKKGSITVEAACWMSLILLVVMGLIYLSFFVHNRAWLTAAAYESAVTGSMEGVKKQGKIYENAKMKSDILANTGFFGAENLSVQVSEGKEVTVNYYLDTISSYGNLKWHLETEGTSAIICPVKWIRKVRSVKEVIGEIGGRNACGI